MNTKSVSIIGFVYALLLIYASLMPFDFSSSINIGHKIPDLFKYWPINMHARRISGSDIISNLVLYIPLGWLIAVRCRFGNLGKVSSLLIALVICSIISLLVEFLQLFTLSRIASASDWILNTISGFVGSMAGILVGKDLWLVGAKWVRKSWETNPVRIVTGMMLLLIVVDALSPFMPTIQLKQVWQSVRQSNFDLFTGLAEHPWHWWVVQRFLLYFVVTLFLEACFDQAKKWVRYIHAAGFIALLIIGLELGKLFVVSRSFNMANIIVSLAGCFVAISMGGILSSILSIKRKIDLFIGYIFFHIFYLAWLPFDFTLGLNRLEIILASPVKFLPLYDYAMGASLNHARLFLQSIFLLGILIYTLRVRYGWFEKSGTGIWTAAIFCGFLGVLQEGGQLFLISRTPSITDIYCFALGGSMGAWVKRPPGHKIKKIERKSEK